MPEENKMPGISARMAVLLSAAVCPGAGQLAQRRWIMGALYLVAFIACLVAMLVVVIVPLAVNLRIIMDFAETGSSEPFRAVPLARVLTLFGLTILIYLAALADTIAYARRQARQRLNERQKSLVQE